MQHDTQKKFQEFIDTQLNLEQKQAVEKASGVLLVRAGAGSGKTRVITARITNLLINHAIEPSAIIALTFTNKAAREMKERVQHFMPYAPRLPYVGTFHSYCLRLLKIHSNLLAFPEFTVLDDDDQEKMVKGLIAKYGLQKKVTARNVLSAISRSKNNTTHDALFKDPIMEQLADLYEKEKKNSHCFDFDDLLLEVLNLFKTNAHFKTQFHKNVKHILIDEYQDTNHVQHALLKEMAYTAEHQFNLDSLCIVGDEDQSIYSWRGATIANIINFAHDFPDTQAITIEQNYRSVQPILESANAIIQHNKTRNPKKLWSHKKAHDRVRLLSCASSYQEGEIIALCSQQIKKSSEKAPVAILYRSHYQSRTLEEALIRHSIPYKIIGGIQFYSRQEIKDLLAYLRLIVNPFDRISFKRVINVPKRGLGDAFEEQFLERWEEQPFSPFHEIGEQLIAQQALTKTKQEALSQFIQLFKKIDSQQPPAQILETIVTSLKYFSYLKDEYEQEDAVTKIDNVKELINAVKSMEERGILTLSTFLDEVALLQEHATQHEDTRNPVFLMTLHAAKGLEFDTVLLTGLEENILPSAHALFQPETLEEERRLLYVGITRARERLLITHTRYRYTHGQMTDQRESRFLRELPESFVARHDCSQWNIYQSQSYLYDWIYNSSSTATTYYTSSKITSAPELQIPLNARIMRPATKTPPIGKWKVHQPVSHPTFGEGLITSIEEKNDASVHLTIKFKTGIKKIASTFVKAL